MTSKLWMALAVAALLPGAPAGAAGGATPAAHAADLAAADRSFAASAGEAAAGPLLLRMLDEEAVAFIVPVPGLAKSAAERDKLVRTAFAEDERLAWSTVRVGVSADGSHGFTYGFMDRAADGKPVKAGKYVAYWVRRPAGWRIAAFKWVPRADGAVDTAARPPLLPVAPADVGGAGAARSSLDATERQFSDEAQVAGLGAAFRKFGRADAMNVGGGADFTYGNEAIAAVVGAGSGSTSPLTWAPDGVLVSPSGDLGVTFGYLTVKDPPPGRLSQIPFFTVWRRDGAGQPWRYIAE